ncbi:MAG TPA: hypothetical protein VFA21_11475 [Pyrinomonadaceae bacterium]|jgi:hypothetical protein|nr:hypothetical protein [Pyrinomonadaceae bacterium]
MKAYIISFYQREISDDELVTFLESKGEVLNLVRSLPNTIFIVSDRDASRLTNLIDKKFPQAFFIVAEYNPYNTDGSLTGEMWDFLNSPRKARRTGKSVSKKRRIAKGKSIVK